MKKKTKCNLKIKSLFFLCILHFAYYIINLTSSFSQNINITLAGQIQYPAQTLANIWGYVDSLGNEYALVGASDGLSIVNVTNPSAPFQVAQIPVAFPGNGNNLWREVETWGKYAYVTTEAGGGLQIVDLSNLPGVNLPFTYWTPVIGTQTLDRIHSLHIDNGKVYLYGSNVGNSGAIIADVATNPMNPIYLGSYDNRYIHDGYVRGDTLYACHIFDGDCEIINLSNPAAGVSIGDFITPGLVTNNSWLSNDSKTVFTTDEVANSFLTSYDISNLSNIYELDRIQSTPGTNKYVHNTHILYQGGAEYAVTSWYTDGVVVVDVTRPDNMVEVGHYDTSQNDSSSSENSDWGVYPFLPSGTLVVSDMQMGLFVLSPNYVRASYLEGVVTNCTTGNPLSGVLVQILNPPSYNINSATDTTDATGNYGVGMAAAGTYTVVFSKIGFTSDTNIVVLSSGIVTALNKQLCLAPTFIYTGNIYDNSTSVGIAGANVSIYSNYNRWDTITDANGNFKISTIFGGTYTIAAGKWGHVSQCLANQIINPSSGAFSMGLDKGIYDDFMWDWGWTVSGNATQGMWVREVPLGTYIGITPINPSSDVSNDCSNEAYITGNTGVNPSDDDVDGGATVLTSPTFDLTGYTNPYIYYSRWKVLYGLSDSVKLFLYNGVTSVALEKLVAANSGQSEWIDLNYKISDFITPSSTMKIIVIAEDNPPDNIVEAGLDRFFIADSANSTVNEFTNNVNVIVYPNPFRTSATLEIKDLGIGIKDYKLQICDVFGKIVKSQLLNPKSIIRRGNLKSGIYFYKIINDNTVIATGKLCVE